MDQTIEIGRPVALAPGLTRLTADNPSPLTGPGTNSYAIGAGEIAIVDPGPDNEAHLERLLALPGRITAILVTHAHLDHSAGAPRLAAETGAPVYAFGPPTAGRSARMDRLAGQVEGGEGLDADFRPDRTLADGDPLTVGDLRIEALHTPGHFGGHLAFAVGNVVLSGDLAMGWATTLISPPDGDVAQFRESCARLVERAPATLLPGHGTAVTTPAERLTELLAHRAERERQIRAALNKSHGTAADLAARIYTGIPPALLPAAARNVLAHLIDLTDRGLVETPGDPGPNATFHASKTA